MLEDSRNCDRSILLSPVQFKYKNHHNMGNGEEPAFTQRVAIPSFKVEAAATGIVKMTFYLGLLIVIPTVWGFKEDSIAPPQPPPREHLVMDLSWPVNQYLEGNAEYKNVLLAALEQSRGYMYSLDVEEEGGPALIQNVTTLFSALHEESQSGAEPPKMYITFRTRNTTTTATSMDEARNVIDDTLPHPSDLNHGESPWSFLHSTDHFAYVDISNQVTNDCPDEPFPSHFLQTILSFDIGVTGVAYNAEHIPCFSIQNTLLHHPSSLSSILLTIDFQIGGGAYHAQHLFDDYVSSKIKETQAFTVMIRRKLAIGGGGGVIYKFRLVDEAGHPAGVGSVSDRHHLLFHKLAERWALQNDETVILDTFNSESGLSTLLHLRVKSEVYPKDALIPVVGQLKNAEVSESLLDRISPSAALCKIGTKFSSAVVTNLDTWNHLLQTESMNCTYPDGLSEDEPLNLTIYHSISPENLNFSNSLSKAFQFVTLVPTATLQNTEIDSVELATKIDESSVMLVGCHLRFGYIAEGRKKSRKTGTPLVSRTISECSQIFNISSTFVWEFELQLESRKFVYYPKYYSDTVLPRLNEILAEIHYFGEVRPDKDVILQFDFTQRRLRTIDPSSNNVLCRRDRLQLNQLMEAVINWGYMNHVQIMLKTPDEHGVWSALHPHVGSLKWVSSQLPVFLSLNYPPNLGGFYPWNEDPCSIDQNPILPQESFSPTFFDERWTGASLNLTVRESPLKVREVQVLLQFGLHKLSNLELVLEDNPTGSSVIVEALSQEFLEFLRAGGGEYKNRAELYLSVSEVNFGNHLEPVVASLQDNLSASNNTYHLGGVHVVTTSGVDSEEMAKVLEGLKGSLGNRSVPVGLLLHDCVPFISQLLTSVGESQLLGMDYLVCSIIPREEEGLLSWSSYLEGHLYISKILKRVHPALKVIFRTVDNLKLRREQMLTSLEMLVAVNKTAEFARTHQLNYFLMGMVAPKGGAEGLGWWNISNYSDLTDGSVYAELEAETLGIRTWRPVSIFSGDDSPSSIPRRVIMSILAMSLSLAAVIVFAGLLLVHYLLGRNRARFLTDDEVMEFRAGTPYCLSPSGGATTSVQHSILKYDLAFEIPKSELNLGAATLLLGKGNFGNVFKSGVRGKLVAIKMPTESCSKVSFKSMLLEIKIMCHLGAHPNLVQLVGCHTAEIGRGMVYIVTELCENGPLEGYLRRKDVQLGVYEMCKFSYEIACGMRFIAEKNVVHGDLSSRNVLLGEYNICKIADFGLARKLAKYEKGAKRNKEPLPWRWMAWEALSNAEFSTKSDIWSFGVTTWEIFSLGSIPYPGRQWSVTFPDELKAGLRMETPEYATPEIYNMVLQCWSIEPAERPSFPELAEFFLLKRSENFGVLEC